MTSNAPVTVTDEFVPGLATQANRPKRYAAIALMSIAALFSGVVLGVMLAAWLRDVDPIDPQASIVREIKAALLKDPNNATLTAALRNEDVRVRQAFEARRQRLTAGTWMLAIGLVVFAAAARWYVSLDASLPKPRKAGGELRDTEPRLSPGARAGITLGVVALALAAALLIVRPLIVRPVAPPIASSAKFKDNWPTFRGPTGCGLAPADEYPTEWDDATGKNILWKAALPLAGKSSPIVWGDRVFVTAADAREQKVICVDRASGRILWQTEIKSLETIARLAQGKSGELSVFPSTGYAAPTPVTDGKRVYAVFASADLAAVDFNGKIAWVKNFGTPDSSYGLSASLAFAKDTVIFQFDQGASADDKLSAMLGLDPKTGGTVWRTERAVRASWSSPIVVTTPKGEVVLTAANPFAAAYDAESGSELWRCEGLSGDVAPSPVYANGKVYVTQDMAKVMAIRADGSGDVTATHVAWTAEEGMSDASSPIATAKFFLQAKSGGQTTCFDAGDGKLLWTHDLGGMIWASPALAGDLVYLSSDSGATHVFRLGAAFQLIRENKLREPIEASPAFGDGQIIIRGEKHLFCIGRKP